MSADLAAKSGRDPSSGRLVLVVEDRGLIAAKITQILESNGWVVLGPAATLESALELAWQVREIEAAVLDIDLRGSPVYPLTELLAERHVPFLFLTGYDPVVVPERWRGTMRVEKPFEAASLVTALQRLLAGVPGEPGEPGSFDPASALDHRAFGAIKESRNLIMERRVLAEDRSAAVAFRPSSRG
ncbi:MAG: hypothetical protein JOZ16_01345 [Methylobacteriaceae bacterium]|nr:hypothetical protein [Methylobacteriaceae bacterium]